MARKQITAPSYHDRLNAASATADAALSVFEKIAADLDQAAHTKAIVAEDIQAEINEMDARIRELCYLRDLATEHSDEHFAHADKIRAFVGA